jgi:hypothetical protein
MRRQGESGGVELAARGGDPEPEDPEDEDENDEDVDTNGDEDGEDVGYKALDNVDDELMADISSSAQPG